MKQKNIIILTLLLVLGAGAFIAVQPMKNAEMSENQTLSTAPESPTRSYSEIPGKYIPYTEAAFSEAEGVKVLFFHASWCRQCQMIENGIETEGVPSGVTVFKIDYDSATELRKRYGVTLQTTVIKVTNDGQIITKFVAYDTPTFAAVRQNLKI